MLIVCTISIRFLLDADPRYQVQVLLEQLKGAIISLSGQPNHEPTQAAFASALDQFGRAVGNFAAALTSSQVTQIAEISGTKFFSTEMIDAIRAAIRENPMTPTVTSNLVQELAIERAVFIQQLSSTVNGIEKLGFHGEAKTPGTAEIAFLIPRQLFDNNLEELAEELGDINRIIRPFSEIATGAPEKVELHQISTSDPIFSLGLHHITLAMIGGTITGLLDTWKRLEEIRSIRQKSKQVGLSEAELKVFDDRIRRTVDEAIDTRTKQLLEEYKSDNGRRHELEISLNLSQRALLSRIERGNAD